MNIQHSSRSDEWYTPKWVIDKTKTVLGEIDFDPASDSLANVTVQAKQFFNTNSLEKEWFGGSLFLNPPGGKVGNKSQAGLFWNRLMTHKERDDFTHGIFLAFSAEALQNTQNKGCPAIGEFMFCIPSKRIRFDGHMGKTAPSHSNIIVYVPGRLNLAHRFYESFKDVGTICNYWGVDV